MERVDEILHFWFGDGSDPEHERRWFAQDAGFDQACRNGFLADHERAAAGELDSWKEAPSSIFFFVSRQRRVTSINSQCGFPWHPPGPIRLFASAAKAWRIRVIRRARFAGSIKEYSSNFQETAPERLFL